MNTTNANELNLELANINALFADSMASAKAAQGALELADAVWVEAAPTLLALIAEEEALTAPVKKWTLQKGRPEANGIKRPSVGTVCAALWEAVEAVGVAVCTAKDVRALAAQHEWNVNNSVIEFYNCRKFHGVVGRAVKAA